MDFRAANKSLGEEIKRLNEEIESLKRSNSEIDALRSENESLRETVDKLCEAGGKMSAKNVELNRMIVGLRATLRSSDKKIYQMIMAMSGKVVAPAVRVPDEMILAMSDMLETCSLTNWERMFCRDMVQKRDRSTVQVTVRQARAITDIIYKYSDALSQDHVVFTVLAHRESDQMRLLEAATEKVEIMP